MNPTVQRANSCWGGMLHSPRTCRESTACPPAAWPWQEYPGVGQLLVRVGKGKLVMGSPSLLLAKYKDILLTGMFGGVDLGLQRGQSMSPSAVSCLLQHGHRSQLLTFIPGCWESEGFWHRCDWHPAQCCQGRNRDKGKSLCGRVPGTATVLSVAWVHHLHKLFRLFFSKLWKNFLP